MHNDEDRSFDDAGNHGVEKHNENLSSDVSTHRRLGRGERLGLSETKIERLCKQLEKLSAHVKAKVEHSSHVFEYVFGKKKRRYRTLTKGRQELHKIFNLPNLLIAKCVLVEFTPKILPEIRETPKTASSEASPALNSIKTTSKSVQATHTAR